MIVTLTNGESANAGYTFSDLSVHTVTADPDTQFHLGTFGLEPVVSGLEKS